MIRYFLFFIFFDLLRMFSAEFIEFTCVSGSLFPMSYYQGMSLLAHILHVDDILIFCTGSKKNIGCLLCILHFYVKTYGPKLNFDKSKLFTCAMTTKCKFMLAHLSGFSPGVIPFQYLGYPIFQGKPKCIHFGSISHGKGQSLPTMGNVVFYLQ